ncbi:hypothetical protein [Egicoccus sp. AB-alg2]|uniref:hypothetical protein n=1 Tax=Egicoccus sp. AB-alg2 TaxID=3242693 RepID=UPI00359E25D7
MTDERSIPTVQAELETVRRHLHEAPPHHGSGTRAALEERLRGLQAELARLRRARRPDGPVSGPPADRG